LHAVEVDTLPVLHKDPFDRILIAQAKTEGIALLTVDRMLAAYGEPVQVL
jgi:PIN domain nuclease of toxin-antitoxin system